MIQDSCFKCKQKFNSRSFPLGFIKDLAHCDKCYVKLTGDTYVKGDGEV